MGDEFSNGAIFVDDDDPKEENDGNEDFHNEFVVANANLDVDGNKMRRSINEVVVDIVFFFDNKVVTVGICVAKGEEDAEAVMEVCNRNSSSSCCAGRILVL